MTYFSLILGIALALARVPFTFENVATVPNSDPQVRRLGERIRLVPLPRLDAYVNLGTLAAEETETTITMTNGRKIVVPSEPYPDVLDPERDRGRVVDLFTRRVGARWGADRANRILEAVNELDRAASLRPLASLLTAS